MLQPPLNQQGRLSKDHNEEDDGGDDDDGDDDDHGDVDADDVKDHDDDNDNDDEDEDDDDDDDLLAIVTGRTIADGKTARNEVVLGNNVGIQINSMIFSARILSVQTL